MVGLMKKLLVFFVAGGLGLSCGVGAFFKLFELEWNVGGRNDQARLGCRCNQLVSALRMISLIWMSHCRERIEDTVECDC